MCQSTPSKKCYLIKLHLVTVKTQLRGCAVFKDLDILKIFLLLFLSNFEIKTSNRAKLPIIIAKNPKNSKFCLIQFFIF